ncbi:molybdopterin molybdotransferase [Clavibacter sp. B3I6]|uniref:molybdopterin molybdotransferase MoeA n=1 Tax=Clavibacter sp. B3I6 TaxID=3042268 RepID=UPI00277E2D17|nr:molybdopterin-binding protein [Clavibacter sp. B3I6]MDQ0743562.1 molybdopterin molybdotransferase [Clavibacter sp. B3I6]
MTPGRATGTASTGTASTGTDPAGTDPAGTAPARATAPPTALRDASWDDARAAARRLGARMAGCLPAAPELVPLDAAGGRILAHDLRARADLPATAVSAMDGWAVGSPGSGPWRVGAAVLAGHAPSAVPLGPRDARPIATGAPVPPATAGVLRSEHGDVAGGVLRPNALAPVGGARAGAEIRPAGEEARRDDVLLPAGTRLTAVRLGLAAAAGHDVLPAVAPCPADVVHLGDEVVARGVPAPGRVRDAIGPALPALLAACGLAAGSATRVPDDARATRDAIARGTAPLVVTTGGSSRGPADHVRAALDSLRARLVIDAVRMRPGHPVMLAELPDGRAVLCLPGNPLAAVACLLSLAPPLADGLAGRVAPALPRWTAGADLPGGGSTTRLVACALDADGRLVPVAAQGPGMLRGLAAADALAVVPSAGARAGDAVRAIPLPG